MKLKVLKQHIDEAMKIGNGKVIIWYKKKQMYITRIGQFGLIPDVTISFGEKPEKIMDIAEFKCLIDKTVEFASGVMLMWKCGMVRKRCTK